MKQRMPRSCLRRFRGDDTLPYGATMSRFCQLYSNVHSRTKASSGSGFGPGKPEVSRKPQETLGFEFSNLGYLHSWSYGHTKQVPDYQYGTVPVRNGTVLYRTVLHCTVPYCTVPYCTVLYGTVLYRNPYRTVRYRYSIKNIIPYVYRTVPYRYTIQYIMYGTGT